MPCVDNGVTFDVLMTSIMLTCGTNNIKINITQSNLTWNNLTLVAYQEVAYQKYR